MPSSVEPSKRNRSCGNCGGCQWGACPLHAQICGFETRPYRKSCDGCAGVCVRSDSIRSAFTDTAPSWFCSVPSTSRYGSSTTIALERRVHVRRDDHVRQSRLILHRQKHKPLRGAGTLAGDDGAGDAHAAAGAQLRQIDRARHAASRQRRPEDGHGMRTDREAGAGVVGADAIGEGHRRQADSADGSPAGLKSRRLRRFTVRDVCHFLDALRLPSTVSQQRPHCAPRPDPPATAPSVDLRQTPPARRSPRASAVRPVARPSAPRDRRASGTSRPSRARARSPCLAPCRSPCTCSSPSRMPPSGSIVHVQSETCTSIG